jgi:hypothetical protein
VPRDKILRISSKTKGPSHEACLRAALELLSHLNVAEMDTIVAVNVKFDQTVNLHGMHPEDETCIFDLWSRANLIEWVPPNQIEDKHQPMIPNFVSKIPNFVSYTA